MPNTFLRAALAGASLFLVAAFGGAAAQDVTIGIPVGPSTLDPHHFASAPNNEIAEHLYEALVGYDQTNGIVPELASAWRVIDEKTWEFDLRKGVFFHNSAPLVAADVAFSIERARKSTGPSPMSQYVRDIAEVKVVDDSTVRIATNEPFPLLLDYLARIHIVPHQLGAVATTDFDSGKVAIGTGPFQFVEYVPGERTIIRRNERYWRKAADFEKVVFRVISNTSAREAALLSGDVQVIAAPSAGTLERLRNDPKTEVVEAGGFRIVYLGLQQARAPHPLIPNTGDRNPLQDPRVREAISLSIDRAGLIQRVLRSGANPAGQLLYPGAFGFSPNIGVPRNDPERARKLLAEAGYPNGFQVTLNVASDQVASGVEVANAIAGLLSRVGIRTSVEATPGSVLRDRNGRGELAMYLAEYGNPFPDGSAPLRAITGTRSRETGFGTQNFGGYANKEQNDLLLASFKMMDREARRKTLERAAEITFGEHAVIPLYWPKVIVAKRREIGKFSVRPDAIVFAYLLTRN